MEILDQSGIQHVCGMNPSYQQYYLIYLVNANILYYLTNQKIIAPFYWNQQNIIEERYKNV